MRMMVILAVLLVAPAAAQTVVLTDETEDVTGSAGGVGIPTAAYETQDFDLEKLTLTEDPESFTFELDVVSLQKTAQTENDNAAYVVDFQHVDTSYRLLYFKQVLGGQTGYGGQLQVYDSGRQNYVTIDRVDVDVSEAEGLMTMEIPRDMLLDSNGTAPTLGREFTLFRAFASSGLIFGNIGASFQDQMPDSGFSDVPYPIQQGLQQSGHARLWSNNPVRASNGEEATFVFYVEAENLASREDRFDLSVSGVPAGWGVTLPAPTIRIPANGTQQFPVLVSTPFAHQHGAFEHFVLRLDSHMDASAQGRLQIGIRYLEVPQPAGHHDTLWIHTRSQTSDGGIRFPFFQGGEPTTIAYMNAAEEHDLAEELEAPPSRADCCGESRLEWDVWLEPGLQLGLDFDLNRTGDLTLEFTSDLPYNGISLSGQLYHYEFVQETFNGPEGGGGTLLGEFATTPPANLNGLTEFNTVFTPKGAADFIPYGKGGAMAMHLVLSGGTDLTGLFAGDGGPTPRLVSGELELPLFEYRDPVANVFNALAGIDLTHDSPAEKFVNPGETVLFSVTLTNEGAVDDAFQLRVNGTNEDWARILGDKTVFVATGQSRSIVVAVEAPSSAIDGDLADLIITAASDAEPTIQGNIRVVAVVDELIDRPDESHLVEEIEERLSTKKESPGLPVLIVLGALVALARRK